jgi:hypothetical protein
MFVVPIVSISNLGDEENKSFLDFQGTRYIRIIREEKIYELMQHLYDDQLTSSYPDTFLIQLLKSLVHLLKPNHANRHQNSSAVAC